MKINQMNIIKSNNHFKVCTIIIFLFMALVCSKASATISPRPIGGESRIKIINYMPNTVFRYVGHYMYQSIIEFALDEEIQTITMGTPTPWQLVPSGNRIFLKPVENNATTNMTVITNKRMYFFEMHAEEAHNIDDDSLTFIVKFIYPNETTSAPVINMKVDTGPNLAKPELYNFDYKISGAAKEIEPLQVFDDGKFTYMKFRDVNADLPAVFVVDSAGKEGLINYRMSSGYMVVERVARRFTLRSGSDIICVFNEKSHIY